MSATVSPTLETAQHRGRMDKRAAILDAALSAFVCDGYGSARIELIAEQAGVAKPTVYNHFRDKQTLFRTVILDGAQRTSDRIVAALDTLPSDGSDLVNDLTRIARRVIQCQLTDEGWALQRLMYAEAGRFPELFDEALTVGGARIHSALAGRLARLANLGHLETDDPDLAAAHFLVLVSGDLPALSALGTRAVAPKALDSAIASGVTTFLRAFGTVPRVPRATRRAGRATPRAAR